jgi:EAL domain-containing protein (putative c-di-GMP-specific phosphodiesterase class I)
MEGDLRGALAQGALTVVYQPIVALASQDLLGFEALVRWNHPEWGPVPPSEFIPVAEESGQIVALTDFVLNETCRRLGSWRAEFSTLAEATVHVNLSGADVSHPHLDARVREALARSGLPGRCLTLELTESILMDRLSAAMPMLHKVRHLGVRLSIDDFGSGYTSLEHLSKLPVDSLKIDAGFVRGLDHDEKEAAILRAILTLGASLEKLVVAEGIETPSQLARLRQMGCDAGQGYLLCRPQPAAAIEGMLRAGSEALRGCAAGPLESMEED